MNINNEINNYIMDGINRLVFNEVENEIIEKINLNKYQLNGYLDEISDSSVEKGHRVLNSCVAIVNQDFGSGVCISKSGYILTCAHAVEGKQKEKILMIFPTGLLVYTKIVKFSRKLDLALVKIIEKVLEKDIIIQIGKNEIFPFVQINLTDSEFKKDKVFCIGNPCFFDLETDTENEKNNFTPFWLSEGKILGFLKNKLYGEKDLGGMKHSCWTYWGHSGAPIFDLNEEIIGLHNSWNDKTGTRHGVSIFAIRKFLNNMKLK